MRDSRVEAIFDAALEKASDAERAAFLEGACGPNSHLRDRVETLLRAHDAAGNFLPVTLNSEPLAEGPGAIVGRYKLLQKIGEGGFGVVYMAEQVEPVRRKVAFKVIKLGMDTRQVVARFESERQALALMDHANIARVFDAGATESGRPYFVMELVRGVPITEYCDKNGLSTRQRLELFITVCQAVQHAHQKGIIHRDIKPTNVLVTLHDGKPVPKVIDFGIAKATCQRLTEKTVFTEFRQIIGTPQYMSPEQAEMSGLDVDTRCDIYSLGVMLYELLTSTTPFDANWLQSVGYVEMQRIIRDEEPLRPSQRVSTMHEQVETVAKNRRVESKWLSRILRGDLDWIVMKALEKDRTRRYATASDLAADVERHLKNEPVQAGPPGILYKVRKFVRRNRTSVTAAAVVAVALLTGLGLATAGFVRANREADRSRQIAGFLEEIVVAVNPSEAGGRQVDVEEVVRRARQLFGDEHATVAAGLDSLAMQLRHAGKFDEAERLYRESARIWGSLPGDHKANLAQTMAHLGGLLRLTGDDDAAEEALREAVKLAATLPDSMQLSYCDARSELATLLQRRGNPAEAETLVRDALRYRRMHPHSQHFQIAESLQQLTQLLVMTGRDDAAEMALREALELYEPYLPKNSPTAALHSFAYGQWLRQRGRLDEAEPHLRKAVAIYRDMPNPPRDYYLASLDGLFQLMRRRDDAVEETIALFHECMLNMAHVYGTDHPQLGAHLFGFAQALGESNRAAEAIPLLIDGVRIYRKSKGAEWDAAPVLKILVRDVRRLVGSPGLATEKYQAALDGARTLLAEQPDNTGYRALRGMALVRLGRPDEGLSDLAPPEPVAGETADQSTPRLAFLVLALRQSGSFAAANAALKALQAAAGDDRTSLGEEARALVAEVEAQAGNKP